MKRTIVYIDGYNLYYRLLRGVVKNLKFFSPFRPAPPPSLVPHPSRSPNEIRPQTHFSHPDNDPLPTTNFLLPPR